MKTLTEMIHDSDRLSDEEKAGLATHLLADLRGSPLGPDNEELARQETETDEGTAKFLTEEERRKAVVR